MTELISVEAITSRIYFIRNHKVMMDRDLAELYDVETKQLKRAVRRNIDRFPGDFMFELTDDELEILRCQFGTSSWGGPRYIHMAFTEQGVAMLSSVLNSKRAIQVNIQISDRRETSDNEDFYPNSGDVGRSQRSAEENRSNGGEVR
ncbi:ORF6N domain-containing protein [Thermodesulfobacteriota bacterium]